MIKRPKKVERNQRNYMSNEKYQDYAESQFKTIYDYLDGTVLYDNPIGTNGNINFNYAIENGNEIEIIYNAFHYTKSSGKIPFSNGMGITLDMQYKADVSAHGCINKLIIVNENGITVNNEQTQIIWNIQGYTPSITDTNYIYITKVIVYK